MNQKIEYPFELINIIYSSISFKRMNEVKETIELPITTEFQIIEPNFPRLQVNMRIKSPQDMPLSFNLEIIGLFDYVGVKKEYDKKLDKEFAVERGFHMLWTSASQLVKIITAQMGINPLQIKTPVSFVDENT